MRHFVRRGKCLSDVCILANLKLFLYNYDLSSAHLIGAPKFFAAFCSMTLLASHLTLIVEVHRFLNFLIVLLIYSVNHSL